MSQNRAAVQNLAAVKGGCPELRASLVWETVESFDVFTGDGGINNLRGHN